MANQLCEEEGTFVSHINLIVHEEVIHDDFMNFCFVELGAIVLILAVKVNFAHVDHIRHQLTVDKLSGQIWVTYLDCVDDSELFQLCDQDIRLSVVDICQDTQYILDCQSKIDAKAIAFEQYFDQDAWVEYFCQLKHKVLYFQRIRVQEIKNASEPMLAVDLNLLAIV